MHKIDSSEKHRRKSTEENKRITEVHNKVALHQLTLSIKYSTCIEIECDILTDCYEQVRYYFCKTLFKHKSHIGIECRIPRFSRLSDPAAVVCKKVNFFIYKM